jgi:hypothetical protein
MAFTPKRTARLVTLGCEWVVDRDGQRRRYLLRRRDGVEGTLREPLHYVTLTGVFCYACFRSYATPIERCTVCRGVLVSEHEGPAPGH